LIDIVVICVGLVIAFLAFVVLPFGWSHQTKLRNIEKRLNNISAGNTYQLNQLKIRVDKIEGAAKRDDEAMPR